MDKESKGEAKGSTKMADNVYNFFYICDKCKQLFVTANMVPFIEIEACLTVRQKWHRHFLKKQTFASLKEHDTNKIINWEALHPYQ